jgi:hypothetical protein
MLPRVCGTGSVDNPYKEGLTMIRVVDEAVGVKQGDVFTEWTVIGKPFSCGTRPPGIIRWRVIVQCECGRLSAVEVRSLRAGTSKRCKECGPRKHGLTRTEIHKIHVGMIQRCYNANSSGYHYYGGRGISVCDEWRASLDAFAKWSLANGYIEGRRLQIDRIDTNGNYEPSNCRWVTNKENCNNKRNNVRVTAFGETKTLSQWSEDARCVVSQMCLGDRIGRGIDPEIAITTKQIRRTKYPDRAVDGKFYVANK